MEVSKKIVCCMRITKQFTLGTFDFFSRKAKDEGEKRVYMVPNAVPQEEIRVGDEIFNVKTIRDFLRDTIQKKGDFGDLTLDTRMVDNEYGGIPEVKRFKIREGILYKLRVQQKQLQPDEEHALECFKMLSEILTEKNGDE